MTGVAIRPATLDEVPAVLELWRRAGAIPRPTDTAEDVTRLVTAHGGSLLVAVDDGRLVGTVIAGWDGWRGGIYRLAVLPDRRRRGLARALVTEAERRLAAQGARRISGMVAHDEAHAVGFWDRAPGWERDERWVRYVKMLEPPGR
ncbi:MAG: GNAT family N-acetyltransferase [Candidatus Rokuibacteriota bacterium]